MKAYLKNYRQSPRKVRLVAGLIKGKPVDEAMIALDFLVKRSSTPVKKLLQSAIANAVVLGNNRTDLFIKELRVDKGVVMKRMMPRAMGSGARINKRTSHITLLLGEKASKTPKAKKAKVVKEKKVSKVKNDKPASAKADSGKESK